MSHEDYKPLRGRILGTLAALAALALFAPAFAACGEADREPAPAETNSDVTGSAAETSATEASSDPMGADAEAAIVATLEIALASTDADAACADAVTERFLRRAFGDLDACKAAQAASKPASDPRVTEVVINPESVAQARARPKGGVYDGQELRAELVLEDGTWKLDSLRSNVQVGP